MQAPITRVVIAGGGTSGWMAAAAISKLLGDNLHITLIESSEVGTVGVGEATIPTLLAFHELLGINEQEFMRRVSGTFKLGIQFENWRQLNHQYLHSFGGSRADNWAAGFFHYWLKQQENQETDEYGNYCLENYAARKNKFAILPSHKTSFNYKLTYAYHFDAGRYAHFLREKSEQNGVKRIDGFIEKVELNAIDGSIKSLHLKSGERVDGDLFIDCSGFRALLIGGALNAGFEDWSHWLPCDRAFAVQTALINEPLPYTRSIAKEAGWQWQIPLQHRMGNGLVFSTHFMNETLAKQQFIDHLPSDPLFEPRLIKFNTGQRRKHWLKNCVALGLASGFLEPLESTSIHFVQRDIIRLIQLFPHHGINHSLVSEYNLQCKNEMERVRDFIILHYHATERDDSDFWRYCRTMELPDSLAHKIELFKSSGRLFKDPADLFSENSWSQVMLGQGIYPRDYHPVVNLMSAVELKNYTAHVAEQVKKATASLPSHQQFINQYCPAID